LILRLAYCDFSYMQETESQRFSKQSPACFRHGNALSHQAAFSKGEMALPPTENSIQPQNISG